MVVNLKGDNSSWLINTACIPYTNGIFNKLLTIIFIVCWPIYVTSVCTQLFCMYISSYNYDEYSKPVKSDLLIDHAGSVNT